MKKRLHDKKAGIALLSTLIIITLAEIISRVLIMGKLLLNTSNIGEPVVIILFALAIMIMTFKGKDRLCYICYGAWIGYFILDQLFELPGMISKFIAIIAKANWAITIADVAFIARIISMITIVAIGILLVEYMNDGTICNRAFNALCFVTLLLIVFNVIVSVCTAIDGSSPFDILLQAMNNLTRLVMVFLFAFFAYDSAKHQLSKTKLAK